MRPIRTALAAAAMAALSVPALGAGVTEVPNPLAPGSRRPGVDLSKPAAPAPAPTAAQARPPAPAAGAVFPKAVSPRYATESDGKARQRTCLDQYNANKASGGAGNGGLNWIEKGGGYYSECNRRLKG